MFKKICEWNRARQRWNAEHEAAWRPVVTAESDGLSIFQKKVESVIGAILSSADLKMVDRVVEGPENEKYISAKVLELDAEIWIYIDQSQVHIPGNNFDLEFWDTITPEEHYAAVEEYFRKVVASFNSRIA